MAINLLLSNILLSTLSFVPPSTFPPAHVVSARHSAMSSVVMQIGVGRVRSSWAAMDDGVPAGILEKDAAVVFRMLDENGDGSITRAEMQTRLLSCNYPVERIELVFGKIDLNKDGVISQAEFVIFQMEYGHELSDADFKKHGDSWIAMAAQREKK